jgi:hypothetical protein
MTGRSRGRGVLNLAVVAVLGTLLGVGGYFGFLAATAPSPRPAPGWELLAEVAGPRARVRQGAC